MRINLLHVIKGSAVLKAYLCYARYGHFFPTKRLLKFYTDLIRGSAPSQQKLNKLHSEPKKQ
jgi:hypothetical protein